jgi:hypothetical protein
MSRRIPFPGIYVRDHRGHGHLPSIWCFGLAMRYRLIRFPDSQPIALPAEMTHRMKRCSPQQERAPAAPSGRVAILFCFLRCARNLHALTGSATEQRLTLWCKSVSSPSKPKAKNPCMCRKLPLGRRIAARKTRSMKASFAKPARRENAPIRSPPFSWTAELLERFSTSAVTTSALCMPIPRVASPLRRSARDAPGRRWPSALKNFRGSEFSMPSAGSCRPLFPALIAKNSPLAMTTARHKIDVTKVVATVRCELQKKANQVATRDGAKPVDTRGRQGRASK